MRKSSIVWAIALIVLGSVNLASAEEVKVIQDSPVRVSYVAFDAAGVDDAWSIAGELRVPQIEQETFPAVVIVHGSNGVDTRGLYHAESLNNEGIVTLEIDLWSARGNFAGASKRPKGVPETLPDAYGALAFLANLPFIDSDRIGIMGFSWGGVVTLLSATTPYAEKFAPEGLRFAAHVAFYPVCWGYNKVPGYQFAELTGAPVLILAGAEDAYDDPTSCTELVASLPAESQAFVSAHVYAGATHGWNAQGGVDVTINDPFSHKGRGGEVRFVSNPEVAELSKLRTNEFFNKAFGTDD